MNLRNATLGSKHAIFAGKLYMKPIEVVYFSGKRREEARILSHLSRQQCISFREYTKESLLNINTFFKGLINILKDFHTKKPHIIICENSGYSQTVALILKKYYDIPLVFHFKGNIWEAFQDTSFAMPFHYKLERLMHHLISILFLKVSDGILPLSENLSNILKHYFARTNRHKPICIVPLSFPEFELDPLHCFQSQNIFHRKKFLLTITNFNYRRKIDILANAIRKLYPYLYSINWKWLILGNGYLFDEFRNNTYNEFGNRTVRFLGRRAPLKYYQNAHAMLYFSGMDGQPNVLLESFFFKTPVVINHDCPAIEFCREDNAIIVNIHDNRSLEKMWNILLDEKNRLPQIAENAYYYLHNKFSLDTVCRIYYAAIQEVLSSHKSIYDHHAYHFERHK